MIQNAPTIQWIWNYHLYPPVQPFYRMSFLEPSFGTFKHRCMTKISPIGASNPVNGDVNRFCMLLHQWNSGPLRRVWGHHSQLSNISVPERSREILGLLLSNFVSTYYVYIIHFSWTRNIQYPFHCLYNKNGSTTGTANHWYPEYPWQFQFKQNMITWYRKYT